MNDEEWLSRHTRFPKVTPGDVSPRPDVNREETVADVKSDTTTGAGRVTGNADQEPPRSVSGNPIPSSPSFDQHIQGMDSLAAPMTASCREEQQRLPEVDPTSSSGSVERTERFNEESAHEIRELVIANADLKLYDCPGAATRRVRMFMIELGLDWILQHLTEEVDFLGMQNRTETFLEKTPSGTLPVLQTRHGHITESTIICKYLEDRFGIAGTERSLYGRTAEEKAVTASWVQKLIWYITDPLEAMGRSSKKYRHFFISRTFIFTELDEQLKQRLKWGIEWLENVLQRRFQCSSRQIDSVWYICEHNRFSMADIVLVVHLDAHTLTGTDSILEHCPLLSRLMRRLRARASYAPSCRLYNRDVKV